MLTETRYSLGSAHWAALEFGNPQTADISVVFLHGWLDNAASFCSVMTELAGLTDAVHGCAVDFPGHGWSSHKTPRSSYPFHDYIDDLSQFLRVLSPTKLLLVGHSLGALVASCYSAAFPEQVAGLVQIEGAGPLAETPDNTVQRLRAGVLSRQRLRHKPARHYATLTEMVERRASVNHIDALLIAPIVERGAQLSEQGWQWRHDVMLQSDALYRMAPAHAQQINAAITCPQLMIVGTQGFAHLRERENEECLLKQFVTISGGHHCHLEQPLSVARLIFGLVNKI